MGTVRESAARLSRARAINKQRNRNNYVRWRTYFPARYPNDPTSLASARVCSSGQRTDKDAKPAAGGFLDQMIGGGK